MLMFWFGLGFGISHWIAAVLSKIPPPLGTVMLAALPVLRLASPTGLFLATTSPHLQTPDEIFHVYVSSVERKIPGAAGSAARRAVRSMSR
ncbi:MULTISPECIES: hypothetical protein [unclassified Caballeronia]|uniref:hypothetical protein n=1 Tax=unclassified Caballeronia TaxID=2646786 RepID=UPI0020288D14|nr:MULTISPECIES: hypothetical protein [unclassified Caballeronia]